MIAREPVACSSTAPGHVGLLIMAKAGVHGTSTCWHLWGANAAKWQPIVRPTPSAGHCWFCQLLNQACGVRAFTVGHVVQGGEFNNEVMHRFQPRET